MGYLLDLIRQVLRMIFLRGSPERLAYSRRLAWVSLALAVLVSAAVQVLYFGDHAVFVILRVFAELVPFMLMAVLLTRTVARFRLARMMLALFLISIAHDLTLLVLSPLPLASLAWPVAAAVGLVAFYGGSSVLQWGVNGTRVRGAAYLFVYILAVTALDLTFRNLFNTVAVAG